jgi:hypothetical protein
MALIFFIVLLLIVKNINIVYSVYNQSMLHLQVKVNVVDVNDNRPHFIFPNAKFNGKYFGAIPVDSQIGTNVLQVKVSYSITVCCYNDSYICGECKKHFTNSALRECSPSFNVGLNLQPHSFLIGSLLL